MSGHPIEFGVRLPVSGPLASPSAIAQVATRAEELSYEALWLHDYIVWTKELDRTHVSCGMIELVRDEDDPVFFESLTTLAFVAGLTRRIRLGTAVLCLPYRQPVVAAKQIANLDVLSGGRLILGVGVGANRSTHNQDFEVLGIPRTEKYDRTRDYLRAMEAIWTEALPSYSGTYVSFPETEIYPKPIQQPHPPIWFGGRGPRAVELVADLGDGWLPTWLTPDGYREGIARLRDALEAAGRGNTVPAIGDEIVACVADTHEEAVRISQATVETLTSGFTVTSTGEAIASGLIGTADEVAEKAIALADAGVWHFELKFIYRSISHLAEQLELFASGVADPVRRHAAAAA